MKVTPADIYERYLHWLMLWVFLVAINQLLEAGAYLVDDATAKTLITWAHWESRAGLIVLLVALILWARIRIKARDDKIRRALRSEYVTETLKRSASIAFFLTFVLLAWLDVAANHTQLPADYFIKLPIVSMAAAFSVSYFCYNFCGTERSQVDG